MKKFQKKQYLKRKGTIHKVRTLKFGDFQTPSPPLYTFKQ